MYRLALRVKTLHVEVMLGQRMSTRFSMDITDPFSCQRIPINICVNVKCEGVSKGLDAASHMLRQSEDSTKKF